jgi:hypothetical protein
MAGGQGALSITASSQYKDFLPKLIQDFDKQGPFAVRDGKFVSQDRIKDLIRKHAEESGYLLPSDAGTGDLFAGSQASQAGRGGAPGLPSYSRKDIENFASIKDQADRLANAKDAARDAHKTPDDAAAGAQLYERSFTGSTQRINELLDLYRKPKWADDLEKVAAAQKAQVGAGDLADERNRRVKELNEMRSLPIFQNSIGQTIISDVIKGLTDGEAKALQEQAEQLKKGLGAATVSFLDALKAEDISVQLAEHHRLGPLLAGADPFDAFQSRDTNQQNVLAQISRTGQQGRLAQISSLFGGPGILNQQAASIRQFLPGAQDEVERLRQDAGHSDEARTKFEIADAAVQKLKRDLHDLEDASNIALKSLVQFGDQVQNTFEKGLGDFFSEAISGAHNFSDVMKGIARGLINDFAQGASHLIFQAAFGSAGAGGGGLGSILGRLLSGLGGGGGGGGRTGPSGTPAWSGAEGPAVAAAANGGLFSGGLRFFSAGGIASAGRPMMAVVGEGGRDEAVTPMVGGRIPLAFDAAGIHATLPGGGKIPAAFFANGGVFPGWGGAGAGAMGGQPQVHLTIINQTDVDKVADHTLVRHGQTLVNKTLGEFVAGGRGRRILSRPA